MTTYDPAEPFSMIPGNGCCHTGATMLDWFAGQARTGLLAADARYDGKTDARDRLAADAYNHAHAMMTVRAALKEKGHD